MSEPHTVVPQLKPCPFCGSQATMHFTKDESLYSHNIVTWAEVKCSMCDASMGHFCEDSETPAETQAAKAWNARFRPKPKSKRTAPAWKSEGFSSKAVWDKHHRALEGMD